MQNSGRKAMSNNSIRQLANKAGSLIAKNPFWVLVIGSLGIHAIFAQIMASPVKKSAEPPLTEVKTATLPVIKLPPQSNKNQNRDVPNSLIPNASSLSKSIFDNMFVQSPSKKLISPSNTAQNSFQNSVPSPFDLSSFDRVEDLLPPITSLPDVPPLTSNFGSESSREFVRSRIPSPLITQTSRLNIPEQIDNSNSTKTASNSNLRAEFNNNGLRDNPIIPSNEPKNIKNTETPPKPPQSPISPNQPINPPPSQSPSQSSIPSNVKQIESIRSIYTNARITDLLTQDLLEQTRIVPNPKDAVVSRISGGIEDLEWIPVKGNVYGKRGTVTFLWLVDPSGKVEFQGYTLEGDRELVEIVAQSARDYRFKANEGSRKYRFVTAKYEFPSK